MIRVLLVDDHSLFRDGIKKIFTDIDEIGIVGEAEDGNTLLSKFSELQPDVILTDIAMPNRTGLEAIKTLTNREKNVKALFLSQYCGDDYINSVIKSGGHGLVGKNISKDDLVVAIKTVYIGEKYFFGKSDLEVKALRKRFRIIEKRGIKKKDDFLTKRESEVLLFISNGLTNEMTATKLKISIRTVEAHRYRLMNKLGLKSVPELVKYAAQYFEKDKGKDLRI